MTDAPLEGHEFTTGEGEEHSPEEFVDLLHDPDILYYQIKDSHVKAQKGLAVDAEDKSEKVQTFAKVEVFQSAIQYVEAFSIYLIAYLKGRENLIGDLTTTYPSDVADFYSALDEGRIEEWLEDEGIEDDYQTLLETVFGYLYLETVDHPEEGELDDEELQEKIEESTEVLDGEIRSIGEFYTIFHDIYNAVKHGNRVLPETENEFALTPSDEDGESIEAEVDMEFVLFVCKNHDSNPYTVLLPIDYLLEKTLSITETVHDLFNHLKEVSEAVIKEKDFDISFFAYKETDGGSAGNDPDWIHGHHQSGIFILPRTEETTDFLSEPSEWTFSGRIELKGDELHVRTENEDEISDEFPIEVSVMEKGFKRMTPQPLMNFSMSFTINDLDASQYYELFKLQGFLKDNSLEGITVHDEQTGNTIPAGVPEDFPIPDLVELLEEERMKQVALLQKITQRHISVPLAVSEEQIEVIDEAIEADLDREDAFEFVNKLEKLGQSEQYTEVVVEKLDADKEVIESKYIDAFPGSLNISVTDDELGEDVDVGEIRVPTRITDATFRGVVESLRSESDGMDALDKIVSQIPQGPVSEIEDTPTNLLVLYRDNEPGFWFAKDELHIQVGKSSVSHPPIRCELCGQATTDVEAHLLGGCPVLKD
ncbi:hypothetical protein KI372_01405 [Halobacterium salinarum]|uniref:hypothetical protein n=1 Tax=Halobacterium salinarum TaxID=2242 RepID=UPI001F414BD1|nr:hypothetical protein [Halobacterium salinarum]MCF2206769.1 hypothetical protein [Halobacterium salinarum]MCF2240117.1 hypothetical protein [Halobacterium salinarum]